MKKLGLGVMGVVLIGIIYYFTSGATQITNQIKEQIDTSLAQLQTKGFSVEGKELSTGKKHFVITLENTEEATRYLQSENMQVTQEDMKALKGSKVALDVTYMPDTMNAVAFEIYPLALPYALTTSEVKDADKEVLEVLQTMIDKKSLLLHVDVNKLGTGFTGYMKDINEMIDSEDKISLHMTGFNFKGKLEGDALKSIHQTLEIISLKSEDNAVNIEMKDLESDYTLTGTTAYDYETKYLIKTFNVDISDILKVKMDTFVIGSTSTVKDGLLSVKVNTKMDTFIITQDQKTSKLDTLNFDMKIDNLNAKAIQKLETIDPENDAAVLSVLQELISEGVRFKISDFSIHNVEFENEKLDGFTLNSTFDIDKSLNLSTLEEHPESAISAIDATVNLTLSNALFVLIAQQPKAMMAMMLFQPKDVKGKKVYNLKLEKGKFTVNGSPVQ